MYEWYIEFKNFTSNYLHRKRIIRKEIDNLMYDGIILDIGSGVSPMIEVSDCSVFGDISIPSMKIMKKKGANCSVLDIINLGLRDKSVDIIVCSEVLEHISDHLRALREMKRILKGGGMLLLTIPINDYYWLKDDELVGHLRRYDSKKFIKKIEELGFDIIKTNMVGSLTERLTTFFITTIFLSTTIFSGRNKKPPNFMKKILGVYKNLNIIWSYVILLTSKITHPKLSSLLLVVCEKNE